MNSIFHQSFGTISKKLSSATKRLRYVVDVPDYPNIVPEHPMKTAKTEPTINLLNRLMEIGNVENNQKERLITLSKQGNPGQRSLNAKQPARTVKNQVQRVERSRQRELNSWQRENIREHLATRDIRARIEFNELRTEDAVTHPYLYQRVLHTRCNLTGIYQ